MSIARAEANESQPPEEIVSWLENLRGSVRALEPMEGGAGARRYWRVRLACGDTAVLMHALSEDPRILPPALRRATGDLPFLLVSELLERYGLPVPARYGVDASRSFVLLEDLGDRRLCDLAAAEQSAFRPEVIAALVRVHAIPEQPALPFQRRFDPEWIRFELRLFLDELCDEARAAVEGVLPAWTDAIAALPTVLCLRDVQSQNLMIDARGRLRFIDYQDALLAPPELDLAAFLFDSYVALGKDERAVLLERYETLSGRRVDRGSFAAVVAQRKCKDWSRFRYVARRGNARYAPFAASAREAVRWASGALPAGLAELGGALERALGEAPA